MTPGMSGCAAAIEQHGYGRVSAVIGSAEVERLLAAVSRLQAEEGAYNRGGMYAARHLLQRVPEVAELACSEVAEGLVAPVLGPGWRAVRAIYFDKTPAANWKVPWHQDLTIAVREHRDAPGFGPWSVKGGIPHVQPPVEILERMLAVRFALDENDEENGPLRVLPGTHALGRLSADEIARLRDERDGVVCPVPAGGVLLMRPLLLHASSPMASGRSRRVIHIEYAAGGLPHGLE